MTFDIIRFCDDYNIDWWPPGINVSKNYIGVTCPFCDDTFNHLGIHQSGSRKPYCWKCGTHSLYDYIRAVSSQNPKEIFDKYSDILSDVTWNEFEPERTQASVCIPPGSKDIKQVHKKYLEGRGFDPDYINMKYDIRVTSMLDDIPYRIVFPITYKSQIVSYQGRSFVGEEPKYMTCPPDKEVVFHKDIFFNTDNSNTATAIIVEGVFDCIRLGDNTLASFGTAITPAQLRYLITYYDRVYVLYDPEEQAQKKARIAAKTLSSAGLQVENLLLNGGDPGSMTDEDAMYLKRDLNLL